MFARIYLDENVSVVVAEIIRSRGFEALTAKDADNRGLSDEAQLKFASDNGMAILTHDRIDFEILARDYFSSDKSHQGIIITHRRTPQLIAERLIRVINRITADEIANQVIYI